MDDNIAKLFDFPFLKHIHPNYITLAGMTLNFVILYCFIYKYTVLFIISVIARYLFDLLDGFVSRKYNKTSQLGGLLDTISDFGFFVICAYTILNTFISNVFLLVSLLVIII